MSELLQDYVTERADREGESIALVLGEDRMSYAELEASSNRLAHGLLRVGCVPGDRICLLIDKSPEAIVAMHASLKAGCAYVPIDVTSPAARVQRIVRSADPAAVLVSAAGVELCQSLHQAGALGPGVTVGGVGLTPDERLRARSVFDVEQLSAESPGPLPRIGRADDLAHILFTSGSTGTPKGVMISHANVRAFIDWAVARFGISPGDRISGHPPLHFDLSTFDIYGAFCAGATLHLVPGDLILARQFAEFIIQSELVQWFSVPSAMTYMARFGGLPEAGFPSLERVLWCGEVLPVQVLAQWMQRAPGAVFTNLYGPTEATIASSYHTVTGMPTNGTATPIGRACAHEELFVVGDEGEPVADGELGEIYIGGPGVSPGYWRDEDATRAAFVTDPRPGSGSGRVYRTGDLGWVDHDGLLNFGGRRDTQIKSRGYRIELGEIEAAIGALSGIAECAVVSIADERFAGTTICCAFVAVADSDVPGLRAALREVLPAYMLPMHWQKLDRLPTNQNGKIDRRAVTGLFAADVMSTCSD